MAYKPTWSFYLTSLFIELSFATLSPHIFPSDILTLSHKPLIPLDLAVTSILLSIWHEIRYSSGIGTNTIKETNMMNSITFCKLLSDLSKSIQENTGIIPADSDWLAYKAIESIIVEIDSMIDSETV